MLRKAATPWCGLFRRVFIAAHYTQSAALRLITYVGERQGSGRLGVGCGRRRQDIFITRLAMKDVATGRRVESREAAEEV